MEPPISLQAAYCSSTPGDNAPITRVVIHATCPGLGYPRASAAGMALSTARYFAGPRTGGSAHYVADVTGEQHCVREDTQAWHAPPNAGSIGIEICADVSYTTQEWLSGAVWPAALRAAARAADVCTRYSLPVQKLSPAAVLAGGRGICGHWDVTQAWRQSTHVDPGPNFPWSQFMAAVQAAQGGHPAPPVGAADLPTLRQGQSGRPVEFLQMFMARVFPAYARTLPATGFYGPQTAAVIKEFQARAGVTGPDADGTIVGPRTNAALWAAGYRGVG